MNNGVVAVTCIIALFISMINLLENDMIPKKKKEQLDLLALLIVLEIVIDIVLILSGKGLYGGVVTYKILKIAEFTISPILTMIFAKIIARDSFWMKIRKVFVGLICINVICQIITFFKPIMFEVDEKLNYSRTPFTYVYLIILIACVILLIVSANNTIIQNYTKVSYTMVFSVMLLITGIIIRGIVQNTNSDWLCITFCYLIFVINFCNSYMKIDSLTTLLNRKAFDNKLAAINYSTAIIVIDANEFKSINDNYGHQSGDWALTKIAEIIVSVYGKVGFCYRIGGDEFCVILKRGMLEKMTLETECFDAYRMLNDLTIRMNEEVSVTAKKYPVLKNGVAQGFGVYFSKLDKPSIEKTNTIEEVFYIADERMYVDKEKRKHTNLSK